MKNSNTNHFSKGITLKTLIHPIDEEDFLNNYWNNKGLYISTNSNLYEKLMTLSDFDRLVTTGSHNAIRLVKDHQVISSETYTGGYDKENMIRLFNEGYSMIYESFNHTWEPLRNLCWNIKNSIVISDKVYANVYFTPAASQAFNRHVDPQDTFILQIEGSKIWRLFRPTYKYPINHRQSQNVNSELVNATQTNEFKLKKGDLLYVPRGIPHEVFTTDENSLHITLTIESLTNYAVLINLLNSIVDQDEYIRDNIPLKYFNNPTSHITKLLTHLINETGTITSNSLRPQVDTDLNSNLSQYFKDQEQIKKYTKDMHFALRSNFYCEFMAEEDSYTIKTRFRKLRIDSAFEELEFIQSGEIFSLDSLPGQLDEDSKLQLIRSLIKIGILTLIQNP